MNGMKMSEHFPEAFQVDHNKSFEVQDAVWYSYGEKYESDCEQDSAIEHAVLNHDRMVEEVAELKGDSLELIKAIKFLYKNTKHINELQSKNIESMIEYHEAKLNKND